MQLVICSKSTWDPAIRREHAVARSAAREGEVVVFIERPLDVRALSGGRLRRGGAPGAGALRAAWLRGALARPRTAEPGIEVVAQSTLVPGHRSAPAQALDAARLLRTLRTVPGLRYSTVVATQPWQWPAVARAPAARRVFDCADDWRLLIPERAGAISSLHARIAREADALILASPALAGEFAGARVAVVRNGADPALLAAPRSPVPPERRLVYAGTLSERFDAPLLGEVLERLPGWTAELYGQCQYAGHGEAPAPELERVLDRHRGRLRWCGPVPRSALAAALDRGRVLIAPHRAALARGQDSMKLYDYAARRRPIVATPGALGDPDQIAGAGVTEAGGAESFAAAIASAAEVAAQGGASEAWLADSSWESRWRAWRSAAIGSGDGRP